MSKLVVGLLLTMAVVAHVSTQSRPVFPEPLGMVPPPVTDDPDVRYDYPIVYVRAPRDQETGRSMWAEVGNPRRMAANSPLMILYPDGTEEVLVPVEPQEAVMDPMVSIDGEWVYYAKLYDAMNPKGADIFKVHVPTKKIVQLTHQEMTPNTGVGKVPVPGYRVFNLGPAELPGGRVVFVSDRNLYEATNPGYAPQALALQLFTMDAHDGGNVEEIGQLNLGMALHPSVLKDGRIMFSTMESQGLRSHHLWGLWSIHPDGTNWSPMFSAFQAGGVVTESIHFQTQSSDGTIVVQEYYNLNNFGFGPLLMFPVEGPDEIAPEGPRRAFGPAYRRDPRNAPVRLGRMPGGGGIYWRYPFSPFGLESLTPFVIKTDEPSNVSVIGQADSPRVGKFTHPSAAPDNHVLTVWTPGSVYSSTKYTPAFDAGIYLIKDTRPVSEPAAMRLIKNDPLYNEQWPRAVVPYKRIYGIDAPAAIPRHPNRGTLHAALPEGTPFGLVGSSSLYKRESFPYGQVPPGSVTAQLVGTDSSGHKGLLQEEGSNNWHVQGADAGIYDNSDIHAIRIVHLEPTTELGGDRRYYNHAREKMRILGEIPVRQFNADGSQPLDPDGNPDTSFLARIPADVAWTFQTIDKRGMVLNSSQTWHQIKPGETRTNCGGCHAHSQKPTEFAATKAGRAGFQPADLTVSVPLVTSRENDESGRKLDALNETGLKFVKASSVTVEYHRDIQPLLKKSCVPCHTSRNGAIPAASLDLDADDVIETGWNPAGPGFKLTGPGTYIRLAADPRGKWGIKSQFGDGWGFPGMGRGQSASRYIRMHQSRRSLLMWTIWGERTDGFDNEEIPYQKVPGDMTSWSWKGQPITPTRHQLRMAHVGFVGSVMPPPEAVASGLVQPLTDEDKRTFARWIDLGAPIDRTASKVDGWHLDDQRPTLVLTEPAAGVNRSVSRILVGAHDVGTGLDRASLEVTLDVNVDGVRAGSNAASRFTPASPGVWQWTLSKPMAAGKATIIVSVADRQGNVTKIERTFSVGGDPGPPPQPRDSSAARAHPAAAQPGRRAGAGPVDPR